MQQIFRLDDNSQHNEKIVVFGLGNFAGNIINRIIDRRKNLDSVNFAITDEDDKVLNSCKAPLKIFSHKIHDFKKFFAENFNDTDMIFIVDIFGEFKDFALKLAYAAKSSGALTLGIPVQNKEFIDERDLQKFKDYSDSVILSRVNDNGYVNYYDMFKHGSCENLSSFVKNGITPVMKLRLGSERNFFVNGLMYGSPEIVRLFIDCGYDPKSLENNGIFPNTILSEIISRDDAVEVLKILFASGITLSNNLVYPILETKTPEVYRVLANYGWNVHSYTDDKITVLDCATAKFPVEYVKTLIELGADVDCRDDEGKTPLMNLISNLQYVPDTLQKLNLLLDNGAELFAVDNNGKNALCK